MDAAGRSAAIRKVIREAPPEAQRKFTALARDDIPFTSVSGHRGHPIGRVDGELLYLDTGEPFDHERPCVECGLMADALNEPDPCIGRLPGDVTSACCGHGDPGDIYVVFNQDAINQCLRGEDALEYIVANSPVPH